MEKKLYELEVNETLATVMPPLQDLELNLLTQSLLTEGCRDPLVVWNGMIVDGHNRYRICRENKIPFNYIETEFESVADAQKWIIRNQLARRNVPDFVRCELVLPLEEELKKEAKKRQGQRNDLTKNLVSNLTQCKKRKSRDELAQIAGVSYGTMAMAKKIASEADEDTKEQLRNGKMSIYKAYSDLKKSDATDTTDSADEVLEGLDQTGKAELLEPDEPEQMEPTDPEEHDNPADPEDLDDSDELEWTAPAPVTRKAGDLFPGFGVEQIFSSADKGTYVRPDDSVYDIPPVEVFGNMPSGDLVLRGRAEMVHARSDLTTATEHYVRRVGEILRGMSVASINDENMSILMKIVTDGCNQIRGWMDSV